MSHRKSPYFQLISASGCTAAVIGESHRHYGFRVASEDSLPPKSSFAARLSKFEFSRYLLLLFLFQITHYQLRGTKNLRSAEVGTAVGDSQRAAV